MIVSFAWTTPALVAGFKTCTRREWSNRTISTALGALHGAFVVDAYDRSTRQRGQPVARIKITSVHASRLCPSDDWFNEGFEWLTRYGISLHGVTPRAIWQDFQTRPSEEQPLTVVRFEVVRLTEYGLRLREQLIAEGKEVRPMERLGS